MQAAKLRLKDPHEPPHLADTPILVARSVEVRPALMPLVDQCAQKAAYSGLQPVPVAAARAESVFVLESVSSLSHQGSSEQRA